MVDEIRTHRELVRVVTCVERGVVEKDRFHTKLTELHVRPDSDLEPLVAFDGRDLRSDVPGTKWVAEFTFLGELVAHVAGGRADELVEPPRRFQLEVVHVTDEPPKDLGIKNDSGYGVYAAWLVFDIPADVEFCRHGQLSQWGRRNREKSFTRLPARAVTNDVRSVVVVRPLQGARSGRLDADGDALADLLGRHECLRCGAECAHDDEDATKHSNEDRAVVLAVHLLTP